VLSVRGGGCRGAAIGSGLVGLLGWCWEGPVGIVVGCGLGVVDAEGNIGFCRELCIASIGVMVIASSATSAVDCDSGGGWLNVWAVACDWLGLQCVMVAFISVYAVVGIFRVIVVVSSVVRLSAMSSTSLAVDCVMGCVSRWVGAMAGGSPPGSFPVVSEFVIIVIVVNSVSFGGSIR